MQTMNELVFVYGLAGVKDVSKINADSTLADLGLDSLMGTEIQQTLERDFDLVLSSRDIRLLTINKLREIGSDGSSVGDASMKGEESYASSQLNDSGLSINNRFDVLQLVPASCIVHLNDVNNKDAPLFIVHPIEGQSVLAAAFDITLSLPVAGLCPAQ